MNPQISNDAVASLVESCLDIATRLARRYSNGPVVDKDLEQAAMVGIVAAATRYDPSVGPFRPYATATALGELKKHLRSNGWAVGVPRRIQEATITIARATEELEQELGCSPTPQQIATRTGLSVEHVLLALRAHNGRFPSGALTSEHAATGQQEVNVEILDLRRAASHLDASEIELLRLRFVDELTQRELAERIGISQPQVHRRLSRALEHLRILLEDESFAKPGPDDE